MTFHPHQQVVQPFLISSDMHFFYHPSTYSNSLEAVVSRQNSFSYISSNCLLIYVVYWGRTHLLWWPQNIPYPACNCGNVLYQTQLTEASSSWSCLICCFCSSFIPTYCVSATSQSVDTADADADAYNDVDVVLDSLCFLCPPTIVIEQCKLNITCHFSSSNFWWTEEFNILIIWVI